MHYSDNHTDDNDEDEDNELPFKSQGNIINKYLIKIYFIEN